MMERIKWPRARARVPVVCFVWLAGVGAMGMASDVADPLSSAEIAKRIRAHRTAAVTLTVTGPAGRPLAREPVTVRQVRHKFLFGCNAYMLDRCRAPVLERAYRRRFAALFNYATLPFYWGAYEPREGQPSADRLAKMARWCAANGIGVKGHPLCWHQVPPKWLAGRTPEQVARAQWGRIGREVKAFAGRIDIWDVVNEAVVMPDFRGGRNPIARLCKRLGRAGLVKRAFDLARQANPKATLVLNDFMTSARYERLIRQCLDAGVSIDVIGIQSHMHRRFWGVRRAWEVCQRFAKFGKPLHFTELTILSGKLKTDNDWNRRRSGWNTTPEGEKRQAQQVEALYRVLFSHPAVEAITWWDFSDLGAWQGAPAGLVRKDMSPKPAYEVLHRLIKKEWWTGELKLTTDADGRVSFRGFLGDYILQSARGKATFRLDRPGQCRQAVSLER